MHTPFLTDMCCRLDRGQSLISTSQSMKATPNPRFSHLIPTALAIIFGCLAGSAGAQDGWDSTDSDADGLPDAFERFYFGDLSQTAAGNPDLDALTNIQECDQGFDPLAPDQAVPGTLRCERWNGITGTTITSLFASSHFHDAPDTLSNVTSAQIPTNVADNYGVRLRGTLTAPETGDYRFYIASDGQSQLWLGDAGGSKFTRRKIVS